MAKSAIKVVFGCMTFGDEGKHMTRISDRKVCQQILDVLKQHGHDELDTARMYGDGTSEVVLKDLDAQGQGFLIATKNYPSKRNEAFKEAPQYDHTNQGIDDSLSDSLKALGTKQVDLYYLHAPDRVTPFSETLEAIDKHYKAGAFKRFGISNYKPSEVEEICALCDKNGWVKPTVYQGLYNAIVRTAEPELIPVLRKHKISYYVYNPLGGGLFTGQHSMNKEVESGSRFDPTKLQGQMYRKRYWREEYFSALSSLNKAAEKHNLTLAEIAIRWITHHSQLSKAHDDAVIIGASSTNHIEQNLLDFEKGTLPDDVIKAVDEAWEHVKEIAPPCHH